MARRSARIASASKAKPDSELQPPSKIPTLEALTERDGSPGQTAPQSLDAIMSSPPRAPKTPGRSSSPIKPPMSEMHPSKVHATMAPPSSGLRLGFTDIKPVASCEDNLPAAVQGTPSKIGFTTTSFDFRHSQLGPEAQRIMEELRENVERIKEDLAAKREAEKGREEEVAERKMASAKGKAGRFSAAHMAAFKKMDSIANHPSGYRADPGRTTPLKAGVKRSQSRAELDEPDTKPSTPVSTAKRAKRPAAEPVSTVKRARQHIDDDASSNRPVSRDGSGIPKPKSTGGLGAIPRSKSNLSLLMTPTKSSLARSTMVESKASVPGSLLRSPSKPTIGGIVLSASTSSIPVTARTSREEEPKTEGEIKSPSRLEKVKSILRGAKPSITKGKSGLPVSSLFGSKTPHPARPEREASVAPMTTPARKLTKRVAFTPDTQRAALAQNSPSPIKSIAPFSSKARKLLGEVYYPSLDGIIAEEKPTSGSGDDDVSYPTLSPSRSLSAAPVTKFKGNDVAEASAPGTFTFRSDHTIEFGNTSPSFGTSPGQASVRTVRPSILPGENMPGSFPASIMSSKDSVSSPNKENEAPVAKTMTVFPAVPHGMKNKKRNRVSTDEEDAEAEAAERAAKKRKGDRVPEGEALLAPRLVGAATAGTSSANTSAKRVIATPRSRLSPAKRAVVGTPVKGPGTPSPIKRGGLSLSRLQMLAMPKMRK